MLVNYACLLRDKLPPYAVSAIDEQLRFLAAEDTASCQVMIDYYRELGHDFTDFNELLRTNTDVRKCP